MYMNAAAIKAIHTYIHMYYIYIVLMQKWLEPIKLYKSTKYVGPEFSKLGTPIGGGV